VVVNFWASWCGPCIVDGPHLAQVSKEFEGKAQFIGVDLQDQPGPARAFITKYGWTYPSVADPLEDIRDGLGLVGQPITVIYDGGGVRRFVWGGAIPVETLRAALSC